MLVLLETEIKASDESWMKRFCNLRMSNGSRTSFTGKVEVISESDRFEIQSAEREKVSILL
jgi:hypothetical protein